jgi:Ca2+-binding RTX toxin-like protein
MGSDVMSGGFGEDKLFGGTGNDFMGGDFGDDLLVGGMGNDVMSGGFGDDLMNGGTGNDFMTGDFGDDQMQGGAGNDFMNGGFGADQMNGGTGADFMVGGAGNDTMMGDDASDTMFGGLGDDDMYGGAGDDTMHGGEGNDVMSGGDGTDTMYGDAGNDIMNGDAGDDNLSMYGGTGDDVLNGGTGDDNLWGEAGNDLIYSSEGQDNIDGGADYDTIVFSGSNGNGEGNETYATGGTGINYFQFMAGSVGDLILESLGEDTLDFSLYDHGISLDMGSTERQQVSTWTDGSNTLSLWVTLKGLFTNLIGTNQSDTLKGNELANNIEGRNGNDFLSGGAGVDSLYGGDKSDALNSYDPSDGMDTDLDALAYVGGVSHEDNWYSIELPVPLTKKGGGGGDLNLTIPVTGAEPIRLECGGLTDRIFTLELPSGDYARIFGLCATGEDDFWGTLVQEAAETLPAQTSPYNFGAGMTLTILRGLDAASLIPVTPMPFGAGIDYSFVDREGMHGKSAAMMYWDAVTAAGSWGAVPEYKLVDGAVVHTLIHPTLTDGMTILSGMQAVDNRYNMSTNFYGTMLAVSN